jgi:hypothetical protein
MDNTISRSVGRRKGVRHVVDATSLSVGPKAYEYEYKLLALIQGIENFVAGNDDSFVISPQTFNFEVVLGGQ